MTFKGPGSLAYVDTQFLIKEAGVKASEVLTRGDLCNGPFNQLAKIVTADAVLHGGFVQIAETKTGTATNGGAVVDVILRGAKMIMKCANGLQSGQIVKLDVTAGVQKAIAATGSAVAGGDIASGKVLGIFLHYVDSQLTEDGADGDNGVVQTL